MYTAIARKYDKFPLQKTKTGPTALSFAEKPIITIQQEVINKSNCLYKISVLLVCILNGQRPQHGLFSLSIYTSFQRPESYKQHDQLDPYP